MDADASQGYPHGVVRFIVVPILLVLAGMIFYLYIYRNVRKGGGLTLRSRGERPTIR